MRASLLDELQKQYVTTARAKGLREWKLILRYPVRIAINPLISTIGWMLPAVIGGEVVVSKVLNLPTTIVNAAASTQPTTAPVDAKASPAPTTAPAAPAKPDDASK